MLPQTAFLECIGRTGCVRVSRALEGPEDGFAGPASRNDRVSFKVRSERENTLKISSCIDVESVLSAGSKFGEVSM